MTEFENLSVNPTQLPQVETATYHPLDKNYLKISIFTTLIFWGIVLIGSLAFASIMGLWGNTLWVSLFFVSWGLLVGTQLWVAIKGFDKKSYAIRGKDLIYQQGLIWHDMTAIPFNRIQHCAVHQGPIERMYKLSRIQVFTAGGSSSDMSIPGLSSGEAQRIKDFILKQSAIQNEHS